MTTIVEQSNSSLDIITTYNKRRGSNIANPVISAMLNSNTMNNCAEVKDMFLQCKSSGRYNESIICDTAMRYYASCTAQATE
jgi:hypothetical protein